MPLTALGFAIEILGQLPGLISAGVDVISLINKTNDSLKDMQANDRDPTDEEWQALNDLVEELRALRPDVTGE